MNILTIITKNVKFNLNQNIRKYNLNGLFNGNSLNDFNNYLSLIKVIDDTSSSFSVDLYKSFLIQIDDAFYNSDYRKKYCEIINSPERSIITFYGEVNFNRRRYFDKIQKKEYFFVDNTLMLDKYSRFDPFVCAKICELSSRHSYAEAGRIVSELIGRKFKLNDDYSKCIINRATARNIVHRFKISEIQYKQRDDVSILYVMLDEKFVPSQFNNKKDHMIKAAVVFENVIDEYKAHPKCGKPRLRLTGKKVFASIENDLKEQVLDYIYYTYNTDNIKEIVFMGDCANWIKSFKKDFKYHKDLVITFGIDGFHYHQAIQHILTNKYKDNLTDIFLDAIKQNDKKHFITLCNVIIEFEPHRSETILDKQNYILNNWDYIQNYYYKVFVNCSMESHISHCFADIFTARPRAYSKRGLKQLLKLRLLKVNGEDIQQIYFNGLLKKTKNVTILDTSNIESLNSTTPRPYLNLSRLYASLNCIT